MLRKVPLVDGRGVVRAVMFAEQRAVKKLATRQSLLARWGRWWHGLRSVKLLWVALTAANSALGAFAIGQRVELNQLLEQNGKPPLPLLGMIVSEGLILLLFAFHFYKAWKRAGSREW